MEGTIRIRKKDETKIIRGINVLRLSIKIIDRQEIPSPDLTLTLQYESLEEIFHLALFVAQEHDTLTF